MERDVNQALALVLAKVIRSQAQQQLQHRTQIRIQHNAGPETITRNVEPANAVLARAGVVLARITVRILKIANSILGGVTLITRLPGRRPSTILDQC